MFLPTFRLAATALAASLALGTAEAAPTLYFSGSGGEVGTVDAATGTWTLIGNAGFALTDIAFSPTGELFGISFNQLFRINTNNGTATLVGNLGTTLNSLVFGSDGTLYAANSNLYTINTSTGWASLVGSLGGFSSAGDLAFSGGQLYLSDASNRLVRVDTSTGAGTLAASFVGSPRFSVWGTAFFTEAGAELPEPASLGLVAMGLVGAAWMRRRQRAR